MGCAKPQAPAHKMSVMRNVDQHMNISLRLLSKPSEHSLLKPHWLLGYEVSSYDTPVNNTHDSYA